MVVVANPVLVAGRRPGRLDAPEEALVGESREGVVHRLTRDGSDLGAYDRVDVVRCAVRSVGHRPQNSKTLGRHLQAVPAEQRTVVHGRLPGHGRIVSPCWSKSRFGWIPVPDSIVIRSMR